VNVLVVGGGGREHAIVHGLLQCPQVRQVFCAPGNAGIARRATCVPVKAEDSERLWALAEDHDCDLTIVGPEAPLVAGIADLFRSRGRAVCGPGRDAAALEGSKAFAKEFMRRHHIPTADFAVFESAGAALDYVGRRFAPPGLVVKADGLAAGKGVAVARTREEAEAAVAACLVHGAFGAAGSRVVIERLLEGEEVSVMALTDGREMFLLPSSQDHKRAGDRDTGPNTGGMGAVSPLPRLVAPLRDRIRRGIMEPVIAGMAAEGRRYRGVLYAGLMLTDDGPKVLEFNVRLGDPEAQVVLPRLSGDILPLFLGAARGGLDGLAVPEGAGAAVCVIMASAGYPGKYETGRPIAGLDEVEALEGVRVFHAGTRREGDRWLTAGGRVLGVTGLGPDLARARERAYRGVERIGFPGAFWRTDIGSRALRGHGPAKKGFSGGE